MVLARFDTKLSILGNRSKYDPILYAWFGVPPNHHCMGNLHGFLSPGSLEALRLSGGILPCNVPGLPGLLLLLLLSVALPELSVLSV